MLASRTSKRKSFENLGGSLKHRRRYSSFGSNTEGPYQFRDANFEWNDSLAWPRCEWSSSGRDCMSREFCSESCMAFTSIEAIAWSVTLAVDRSPACR